MNIQPYLRHITSSIIICLLISSVSFSASQPLQLVDSSTRLIPKPAIEKPSQTNIASTVKLSHVVVKFRDEAEVRLSFGQLHSKTGFDLTESNQILTTGSRSDIQRLFGIADVTKLDEERRSLQYSTGRALADLNGYYRINVTSTSEAELLINELNALDEVELAYFQPQPEPAGDIAPPTPDYQPDQDYREAAPAGVDADYANTLPGGDGAGVKIIDIEGAWQDTHEDLDKALGGLIHGTMIDDPSWRNHGTAVIGEMIGGDNGYGVTGISPGADIGMAAIGSSSTAEALYASAANLQAGDLILIELHAPGPHYNFESRPDQLGYICMEYWQANFDAIQYAWAKGIIVCEAAGNGSEDFDDAGLYGQVFDTTYRNSHAIIIGAGYPWSSPSNLQKHGFSNYGERVNLQGYGSGVYTTGYGGLFDGGGDENQYYTSSFSGTSSASPIITATVACLQGYYKATYGVPLTADYAREVLVATGTLQLGDISKHIGPRPNLALAIPALNAPPSLSANPIFLDTSLLVGETANFDLWLVNNSGSNALDYSIVDNDSLAKMAVNWLTVSSSSGTIAPADSTILTVTLDATILAQDFDPYKGILEINWSESGGALDSLTTVPVFLWVSCIDTSYLAIASWEPSGPTYEWIDAVANGFIIPNTSYYNNNSGGNPLDDGSAGPILIGFDFNYFGTTYNQMYIGVNGAISFTDTDLNSGGYYSSFDIPGVPFATFISPFWNDLIIETASDPNAGIYIYKNNDTLVVQWHHLANFNIPGDATADFELILTRDMNIHFQYKEVGVSVLEETALIGISEADCKSLSFFDNGDIPANQVSDNTIVQIANAFGEWLQAGDTDADGEINISDLTTLIDYMFRGGPPPAPLESADLECSGEIDITDVTTFVDYLFKSGPPPCYYWSEF